MTNVGKLLFHTFIDSYTGKVVKYFEKYEWKIKQEIKMTKLVVNSLPSNVYIAN